MKWWICLCVVVGLAVPGAAGAKRPFLSWERAKPVVVRYAKQERPKWEAKSWSIIRHHREGRNHIDVTIHYRHAKTVFSDDTEVYEYGQAYLRRGTVEFYGGFAD